MPNYKIYHFKSLSSTQDKAKEFSGKGLFNAVIIADKQTKGRGRFKREWHSGKGGLWMSILLKPENTQNLQYLTFIAAISVAKSIKKIAKLNASIKWPNDVHYQGKKLCGILTEGIFGKENFVVAGIGLNVNQKNFPNDIQDIATSLRIIKNKKYDSKELAKNILDEFFCLCKDYYNKNKKSQIQNIWKRYCDTIGKNVVVITKTKRLKGKAIGVDEGCNLLLKIKNNKTVKIIEGDIRLRY